MRNARLNTAMMGILAVVGLVRTNDVAAANTPDLAVPRVDMRLEGPMGVRLDAILNDKPLGPILAFATQAADGRRVVLCDFASAGAYGTYYRSWLPTKDPSSH